jgi:hypothetical protein
MRIKLLRNEVERLIREPDLSGEPYIWVKMGLEYQQYNYNQYIKFKVIDENLFTESSKKYKIGYKVMREVNRK